MSQVAGLLATFHPKALAEVKSGVARYQRIDRQYVPGESNLGREFLKAVFGADWKIRNAPHRWAPYLYGTRRLHLPKRWKYSLIYLPDANDTGPVVIALAHQLQDEGYWRDRLPPE